MRVKSAELQILGKVGTILLVLVALAACRGRSAPDANSVEWNRLAAGLNRPTDLRSTGDSILITERFGLIRRFRAGQLLSEPALDLRDRVGAAQGEQGLLALALDPNFSDNRHIFVYYTDKDGDTVLARHSLPADDSPADPAEGVTILSIEQPFPNHNGGGLAFGPDGYLYLGVGDGGGNGDPHGNAQRLDSMLGKILRLEVGPGAGYRIPPNNPFRDTVGALPEIWALGLRNPWRLAFDSDTGDLYIADVGESRYEEINFQPAGRGGQNYGWNSREGRHPYESDLPSDEFVEPVAEYGHSLGCAVTGGYLLRDTRLPPGWNGLYLFGDSCSGNIWGLEQEAPNRWSSKLLFETAFSITSFGLDPDGQLYLLDYDDADGALYRLDPKTEAGLAQD